MTYVCWAALYEGNSDRAYFNILIPRIIENLLVTEGIRNSSVTTSPSVELGGDGRSVEAVAVEACSAQEAFHLVVIHADTGGRAQNQNIAGRSVKYCEAMRERCNWPKERCIIMKPSHEMEAWVLADPLAITSAFGYRGNAKDVGLPDNPKEAERLVDPKATLSAAVQKIRRRRSPNRMELLLPAIAQRQTIASLRQSKSFLEFETELRVGLSSLGCLP
ncbi:MAG: hypothetical protein ACKVOJ_01245 [Sphingomonadaceae bacterium]